MGSLNSCNSELQQQAHAQRLELQDAHHGFFESRREQARLQEELSMREKVLRDSQIQNIHEMGEMKRAQELRVDEFSVQKLRESHGTIQNLTSQMQGMQEQMNSMNDSGEFQEVESNHSGRLSYFPRQPEMIPSSRSMLSRDKRLPFDTSGIHLDHRKTFLVINFLHLIRPKIIIKKLTTERHQERQDQFSK